MLVFTLLLAISETTKNPRSIITSRVSMCVGQDSNLRTTGS